MSVFDELALAYDNAIDWNSRLKREMPFILSKTLQAGKALDIACGSGRHAIELAKAGYAVSAFDNSQGMIETGRNTARERDVQVDFRVLDMLQIAEEYHGGFDLVICLGNSLALLSSMRDLERMISLVYHQMAEGGTLIFQTLNFEAVEEQGIRFMPSKTGLLQSGEKVTFSRFLDYTQGDLEKATLVLSSLIDSDDAKPIVETQEVLRITGPIIEAALSAAGFMHYDVYADYDGTPFQRQFDRNIVIRARKQPSIPDP